MDRGAEMTVVNMDIDVQKSDVGEGSVPGEVDGIPQTTSAANLKLHTNSSSNLDTPPVSTSVNPPNSTPAPAALRSFDSVSSILLLRKATVIWPKVYIFVFFSSLYV